MTEITHAVGGATDVDVILELVAKRARALVSAHALLIEIVDGSELVIAAAAGDRPAGLIGQRIALADTVASAALRTRTTHRLEVELTARALTNTASAGSGSAPTPASSSR